MYALDNLAWAALVRGDHERARALHEETLALCRELGDKLIGSESLEAVGVCRSSAGEAERSARLFGTASSTSATSRRPLNACYENRT